MKANPGGQIDVGNVLGRDILISSLWQRLERQSLLLTAERRMGKTTILKKMLAEPSVGFVPIYQDLEGIVSPCEFVETVGLKIREHFNLLRRTVFEGERILGRFAGGEVQGIKLPEERQKSWKSHLFWLIQNVSLRSDQRLVFFWDELPLMLYNIKLKSGAAEAMAVLDVLRNLRQDQNIRMILTGSIGLHHVIDELRRGGYANAPVNDLYQEDVSPLAREHSLQLALLLLEGEGLYCEKLNEVAAQIAEVADDVPYYIHHLVAGLKKRNRLVCGLDVQRVARESISLASDPWDLGYYRGRINTYYSKEESAIACAILDVLSHESEALNLDELLNLVKLRYNLKDREHMKSVLRLLELDHYLAAGSITQIQFRSKLIKGWWKQQAA